MKTNAAFPQQPKKIVYSTTDGRQQLHDILQDIYGDKAVIGFDRYGRVVGAVVPMEAVAMLAGRTDYVDDYTQERIQRAAQKLMEKTNDPRLALSEVDAPLPEHDSPKPPVAQKTSSKKGRVAA
jgi:hypothetical protein